MESIFMANESEKKSILVVDDDESQLDIVKILLNDEYNVSAATSGKMALDYLMQGCVPDLILLDILMPEMDGWETYGRLRAVSFLQDVPIVFVTALKEMEEKKHAYEIGAADFIVKPIVKADLLDKIKKIIDKGKDKE